MKDLKQQHDEHVETVKGVKERYAKRRGDDEPMPTEIRVFRDGREIAVIATFNSPDFFMKVFHVARVGFSAQRMSLSMESWSSKLKENPLSGEEWEQGEMAYVAEYYPEARENGWVTDALNVFTFDENGDYESSLIHFSMEGPLITWGEEMKHTEDDFHVGGRVVQSCTTSMKSPGLSQHAAVHMMMDEAGDNLSPRLTAIMDVAAMNAILAEDESNHTSACFAVDKNDEVRREALEHALKISGREHDIITPGS